MNNNEKKLPGLNITFSQANGKTLKELKDEIREDLKKRFLTTDLMIDDLIEQNLIKAHLLQGLKIDNDFYVKFKKQFLFHYGIADRRILANRLTNKEEKNNLTQLYF